MSESETDIFKRLEKEFFDVQLPEMPADPMQEILLGSVDPLDGAMKLQEYIDTLTDEETERVVRLGTNALRTKHYGEYSYPDKSLEVLVTHSMAFPEQDPARRVRQNNMSRMYLTGYNFVRGTFNNIVSLRTINDEEQRVRYVPAIIMQCPVILDEFGNPSDKIALPDYLLFSIGSVYNGKYAFTSVEYEN